jgi:SAM-dependent methyltransferase
MKITKLDFPYNCNESFSPNLTTKLLYEHARLCIQEDVNNILELGCGCGIISLGLAIEFKSMGLKCSLSDISQKSIQEARGNFKINSQDADIRCGSIFEPWKDNTKFDLIIDDISGIARQIADISPWFSKAPAAPGNTGVELLVNFLNEAPNHLNGNGKIIFPLLNLSDVNSALIVANRLFHLTLIKEVDWPMPKELAENQGFETICNKLNIPVKRKFGLIVGTTSIYEGKLK